MRRNEKCHLEDPAMGGAGIAAGAFMRQVLNIFDGGGLKMFPQGKKFEIFFYGPEGHREAAPVIWNSELWLLEIRK
jgi:hypothetical protein